MPAKEADASEWDRKVSERQIDFVDPGLVFHKSVAHDQPLGRALDAPELGADECRAFGRQRIYGLAAVSDSPYEEPSQQSRSGQQ
jgi:hypothetical protein